VLLNDYIHTIAGAFIIVSLALGYFWTAYWFILTGLVGVNLLNYGLTKFCPMAIALKKLGVKEK